MSEWISVNERLPEIDQGDELHCFVAYTNERIGKKCVTDCYWVNKQLPDDDTLEFNDWYLFTPYGEPWGMVGWCHKGVHPDFDDYYQSADLTVTDWQPVAYPEAPTL